MKFENDKNTDEEYPVKMNHGCFIPFLFFALVGFIAIVEVIFKWV